MTGWDGGGFGDALTVEEVLARKEPLLRFMARGGGPDAVDAVQEARIAIWRSLQDHDVRDPMPWASVVGRRRIQSVLFRGAPWTGEAGHQGKAPDPLRDQATASLDDPDLDPGLAVASAGLVERAFVAYHRGEVLRAVAALPERERRYVALRFWGGMTNPEIAAMEGCSVQTVERRWRTSARPELAKRLAHLAG